MTASVRLYERTDALETVRAWIEENGEAIAAAGGELPPELEALVNEAEGDFKTKAESCALYTRELDATAAAIKAEEARLAARRKSLENASRGVKEYVRRNMEAAGITDIKGVLVSLKVQNSPPAVASGPAPEPRLLEIPEWAPFVSTREVVHIDNKAIIAAWKLGQPIPPDVTVESSTHLRIR